MTMIFMKKREIIPIAWQYCRISKKLINIRFRYKPDKLEH